MISEQPGLKLLPIFTEEPPEPESAIDWLDLRGLRGRVAYEADDGWPSMVFWDVDGTKIEFSPGICGWPEYRELAAAGAEHLASVALEFARAIREYRR